MNIFILDGTRMLDRSEAHRYIARILRLPEYYGENLDALYDCLSEFGEDSMIMILNSEAITENLGEYGESLLDTFRDAAAEEAAFLLNIR